VIITELVDEVMDPDQAVTPDHRIVDWIARRTSPALDTLFQTATRLADYWVAMSIVAVTAIVLITRRHRGAAAALVTSSLGAAAVTEVLKELIGRQRPPIDGRLVHASGLAFPSGHSSQSIACYGGLALVAILITKRTGPRLAAIIAATTIAVLVGASRVYLGVHWPSDVLAGWIVGITWLALVTTATWLLRRLDRPRGWWP
jgi:membrane-associated phospholipid phosphatase